MKKLNATNVYIVAIIFALVLMVKNLLLLLDTYPVEYSHLLTIWPILTVIFSIMFFLWMKFGLSVEKTLNAIGFVVLVMILFWGVFGVGGLFAYLTLMPGIVICAPLVLALCENINE